MDILEAGTSSSDRSSQALYILEVKFSAPPPAALTAPDYQGLCLPSGLPAPVLTQSLSRLSTELGTMDISPVIYTLSL